MFSVAKTVANEQLESCQGAMLESARGAAIVEATSLVEDWRAGSKTALGGAPIEELRADVLRAAKETAASTVAALASVTKKELTAMTSLIDEKLAAGAASAEKEMAAMQGDLKSLYCSLHAKADMDRARLDALEAERGHFCSREAVDALKADVQKHVMDLKGRLKKAVLHGLVNLQRSSASDDAAEEGEQKAGNSEAPTRLEEKAKKPPKGGSEPAGIITKPELSMGAKSPGRCDGRRDVKASGVHRPGVEAVSPPRRSKSTQATGANSVVKVVKKRAPSASAAVKKGAANADFEKIAARCASSQVQAEALSTQPDSLTQPEQSQAESFLKRRRTLRQTHASD
eukprot:TRINITY_DN50912_c1_g1_i2.p1 TRINITY_DN50912_c1_g1~~TRINITY_DN50912_c1_g1_i2.p1  ORF type:complete len:343 (-),score=91.56 TRINITY_DN50912_c1_g1_i2:53-1081(-)